MGGEQCLTQNQSTFLPFQASCVPDQGVQCQTQEVSEVSALLDLMF
jgi:hypothetical protein